MTYCKVGIGLQKEYEIEEAMANKEFKNGYANEKAKTHLKSICTFISKLIWYANWFVSIHEPTIYSSNVKCALFCATTKNQTCFFK